MGLEYGLRFTSPGPAAVAAVLRSLPATRELAPPASGFELRADATAPGIPDASVQAAPYGAYFCDNGGHGAEFLGVLLARLVSEFGAVTVAELE
jgi:hypothetical protein